MSTAFPPVVFFKCVAKQMQVPLSPHRPLRYRTIHSLRAPSFRVKTTYSPPPALNSTHLSSLQWEPPASLEELFSSSWIRPLAVSVARRVPFRRVHSASYEHPQVILRSHPTLHRRVQTFLRSPLFPLKPVPPFKCFLHRAFDARSSLAPTPSMISGFIF